MAAPVDLAGRRFGRLVPERYTHQYLSSGRRMPAWECRCDCGNLTTVLTANLTKAGGHSTSCGCYLREVRGQAKITHGATRTTAERWPEYQVYRQMRDRCYLTTAPNYRYYGALGVRVCDRWLVGADGRSGFACFIADMGRRPDGLTLDRINPFGNYEPSNCRWATWAEQARNKRAHYILEPTKRWDEAAILASVDEEDRVLLD